MATDAKVWMMDFGDMAPRDWILLGLLVAAGVAASAILVRWIVDRNSILAPEAPADPHLNGSTPETAPEAQSAGV